MLKIIWLAFLFSNDFDVIDLGGGKIAGVGGVEGVENGNRKSKNLLKAKNM